ncbi:MAG: glutathione peroxidase [Myxococcales bacterium]|nr:glutathione peroxidase [Myxococcales bacterium]
MIYDIPVETLSGETRTLREYEGKVLVIVNTASKCGLTPQFEGLEALWREYQGRGLVVLGFPCNQFLWQEPGSSAEIGSFCQRNYGVSFPMHAKVAVNGGETHPLFRALKAAAPGPLGLELVRWNFTKFLVNRRGDRVRRFAPKELPSSMKGAIEALL